MATARSGTPLLTPGNGDLPITPPEWDVWRRMGQKPAAIDGEIMDERLANRRAALHAATMIYRPVFETILSGSNTRSMIRNPDKHATSLNNALHSMLDVAGTLERWLVLEE